MKLRYVEIAIASVVLLVNIFGLQSTADEYWRGEFTDDSFGMPSFNKQGIEFSFTRNYMAPHLLMYFTYYFTFIWMACSLPARYLQSKTWNKAIVSICIGFVASLSLFALKHYFTAPIAETSTGRSFAQGLNQAMILYLALLLYQAVRQSVFWLSKQDLTSAREKPLLAESSFFLIAWFVILSGCLTLKVYWGLTLFVAFILPCTFGVYLLNMYWLFPVLYQQSTKLQFWIAQLAATLCINVPLNGYYSSQSTYSSSSFVLLFLMIWTCQLALIIPIAYYLYKSRLNLEVELKGLKTGLGSSDANLKLLKSQINPHFLFNALNTLYAMALLEEAEKTGEGIQRLGDMMRFMLHENMQHKVELKKEIEYLENYLVLQNLRTAENPSIDIKIHIDQLKYNHCISPMLLIPFVENAYKHGISLRQASWIHINLHMESNRLFFDVTNSIHRKADHDPELKRSGIGLENVKQRLALLYPEKHELIIRRNTNEFYIHLTILLT